MYIEDQLVQQLDWSYFISFSYSLLYMKTTWVWHTI